jgi:hypothetical protein
MATSKKDPNKKPAPAQKPAKESESKPAPAQKPAKESEAKLASLERKRDDASKEVAVPGFADSIRLGDEGKGLFVRAAAVSVAALLVAAVLGSMEGDGFRRFSFVYLAAFAVVLAMNLGAVYWVTLQNLVNSNWSVVLRRLAEIFAMNAPLVFVLSLPIVIPAALGSGIVYDWADHAKVDADHLLHHKSPYLNPTFFFIRMVVYFGFWTLLARYFYRSSLRQDETAKADIPRTMQKVAGPAMIAFALTMTFAAIDLLMSVDAHWFSTIFGVYFFASAVLSIHATLSLFTMWLQSKGRLKTSVTVEHYHDLGKMLFAFTVFWAYVGFSQFMLIWYANLPEETYWYKERFAHGWGTWAWALLFCHFVIPFFFLLSRHVKRNKTTLAIGALWMLAMVYIDMYWLVMPTIDETPNVGLMDILCLVGLVSALVAGIAYRAQGVNLIPTKDPRLARSLAFENI